MNQVLAVGDWSQVDGLGYIAIGVGVLLVLFGVASIFKKR